MYGCYSILECQNLFPGVRLSIRSFGFIFEQGTDDSWLSQKQFVTTHPGYLNQCLHHRVYFVLSVAHFQWHKKNFFLCHFYQLSLCYLFFYFHCHRTQSASCKA